VAAVTGWEFVGLLGAAVMLVAFLGWIAWTEPFVLVVLAGSFAVSALFIAFVALAAGAWSP